jgi:hypothetical protein
MILLPAFLYGGVVSIATDCSLAFFYETNLYGPHTGIYFWTQTALMSVWNLLWYPKLLWWWASDEFYYPHSNWKMTYRTAFFYSFCLQILNAILTGLCVQKVLPDPYFTSRLLYTPGASLCTLYFFECMGLNQMIRNHLMRDL